MNEYQRKRFAMIRDAAAADAAAAHGDAEARMLQESEAEGQELNRLTREASKAAGTLAALKGGTSGATMGALLGDIRKAEGDYRAAARRNAVMRRGAFVRDVEGFNSRAVATTRSAYVPERPATSLLSMGIQAGTSALGMFAQTGGTKWDQFLIRD